MKHKLSIAFFLVFLFLLPVRAFAQCEDPGSAASALLGVFSADNLLVVPYQTQEANFVTEKLYTAAFEVLNRLAEFDANVTSALTMWLGSGQDEGLVARLKEMAKQLSVAQVVQTRSLGAFEDTQVLVERVKNKKERQTEAFRRYIPSEQACQADSVGPGQIKAYQASRAVARGFTKDGYAQLAANAAGGISALGPAPERQVLWGKYMSLFCDNTTGDQGCTTPGTLPGRDKYLPSLLWGSKLTLDPSDPNNGVVIDGLLRNIVLPEAPDIILPAAAATASGQEELLKRHAEIARAQTVYNVLGQMIAARMGGSGVNIQPLRVAGGIRASEASTDASYRELQEAMMKDRFNDPEYLTRYISDPEQADRERLSINAQRLEMMNDIYHRSEELLFMEAAMYGHDLDEEPLPSTVISSPQK